MRIIKGILSIMIVCVLMLSGCGGETSEEELRESITDKIKEGDPQFTEEEKKYLDNLMEKIESGEASKEELSFIGAMAYFGILDPGKLLPEKCQLGSSAFRCEEFAAVDNAGSSPDIIELSIMNGRGEGIMISSITAEGLNDLAGKTCTFTSTDSWEGKEGTHMDSGESQQFELICGANDFDGLAGERQKFDLEFEWYPDDSSPEFAHTATGQILAKVQEG